MFTVNPATSFYIDIAYPSPDYPVPTYGTGTAQQQLDGQAFYTANVVLHLPDWSNGAGRPGIIAVHGRNLTAYESFRPDHNAPWGDYTRAIVDAGFVVVAIDQGYNSWSSNLSLTSLDKAYAYLTGITGGTKVGIMASSAGTSTALQWLRRHPERVTGSWLFSSFFDLDTLRATTGWTTPYSVQPGDPNADLVYEGATADSIASVNGAYKITTEADWQPYAIDQGHTPARYPEQWRGGYRITMAHADRDAGVPYQSTKWFVEQVNDPLVKYRRITASSAQHSPRTMLQGTDAQTVTAGGLPRFELRDFFHEALRLS